MSILNPPRSFSLGNSNNSQLSNVPIGAIMAWYGTEDTIPEGWHICDGTEGTYDLRGKFMLGADLRTDEEGNAAHPVGETGGSEEVTLTHAQMPEHSHNFTARTSADSSTPAKKAVQLINGESSNNVVYSAYSGSSQPHPNMPPYLSLIFIQKIGPTPTDYVTEERVGEIVSEALENVQTGEVYSTEETRIGTWIDGKPLYRRVINDVVPANVTGTDTSVELKHLVLDSNEVINIYGTVKKNGQSQNINHFINSNYFMWVAYNNDYNTVPNSLRICASNYYIGCTIVIILEYTKTTDEPATIELSSPERAVFAAAKAAQYAPINTSTASTTVEV